MSELGRGRPPRSPFERGEGERTDEVTALAARLLGVERAQGEASAATELLAMRERVRRAALAQPAMSPRWGGAWRLVPSPALAAALVATLGLLAWWWVRAPRGRSGVVPVATIATPSERIARTATASGAAPSADTMITAPHAAVKTTTSPPATPPATEEAARPRSAAAQRSAPRALLPVAAPQSPPATSAPAPLPPTATAPAPTAAPQPPAGAQNSDGAELLVNATRLLRHEDDATAARALIEHYLSRFPEGVLVEEALFLDVEAASALADGTLPGRAARYLARYPRGRFRDAVVALRDGR